MSVGNKHAKTGMPTLTSNSQIPSLNEVGSIRTIISTVLNKVHGKTSHLDLYQRLVHTISHKIAPSIAKIASKLIDMQFTRML